MHAPKHTTSVFSLFCLILVLCSRSALADPLRIFLLTGQSNMVGMASINHLDILVNDTKSEYSKALWNGTGYKVSDTVYMKYQQAHGKLTVGRKTNFAAPNCFGPELMFGFTLGEEAFGNEKILLVKAAYGGKSLSVDFRPPSSGEGDYNVKPIQYGWWYRTMILEILDTLSNLETYVPGYDPKEGYELAGMVWFQGWNDMLYWPSVREYGQNLANLIRDVRKDLSAPHLPVIVGELGMHGMNPTQRGSDRVLAMRAAEHGVCVLPEFANNTLFVRTAPYAVSNGTKYNKGYHYNGRADTYFHIGQAFGRGMIALLNGNVSTMHVDDYRYDLENEEEYPTANDEHWLLGRRWTGLLKRLVTFY